LPIIHEISNLYKELYNTRNQISKLDKLSIYLKIENIIIECLELGIASALSPKNIKIDLVYKLKIKIEVAKRLIRLIWELKIITNKKYITLEEKVVKISKMASGWIKYLNK